MRRPKPPTWLDAGARDLLAEGRAAFRQFRLGERTVVRDGGDVLLFPWTGDRALYTAMIALHQAGIKVGVEGPAIRICGTGPDELAGVIGQFLDNPPPTTAGLAAVIENQEIDKWDWVLDKTLSCESAGARLLDVDGAWRLFRKVAPALHEAAASTRTS